MRIITVVFASVVTIASSSLAMATDCQKAATQTELNICSNESFKKADQELNVVYKQIRGRLQGTDDANTAQKLVEAQRSWISFRDSECSFESSSVEQGSIYPLILAECLETLTKRRTDDLKGFLNCAEGDPACPVPAP